MKSSPAVRQASNPAKQLAFFIAKFEPATARVMRQCRIELRKLLPKANELVYDNYNFFVIGFSPTERPSDTIVSLVAAANGVGLSFYHGADLPDPQHLLLGDGKQNRFVRLPTAGVLRLPGVRALIRAAIAQARQQLPKNGGSKLVIRSVSAKQRPRRRKESAP